MNPKAVVETDLNFDLFSCCGDEDLYPFKCPRCGRVMVFCYECGTLYRDLSDLSRRDRELNHFEPDRPAFPCPGCGYEFEYYFMRNPRYQATAGEWAGAGFGHLLREGVA
jgi:predicted RNA-binding Zn-ribbon protein involved in translation (DUF1610 family)